MMELAKEKQVIDIYNFVFSMRNSRPQMVQTAVSFIVFHAGQDFENISSKLWELSWESTAKSDLFVFYKMHHYAESK